MEKVEYCKPEISSAWIEETWYHFVFIEKKFVRGSKILNFTTFYIFGTQQT